MRAPIIFIRMASQTKRKHFEPGTILHPTRELRCDRTSANTDVHQTYRKITMFNKQ